MASTKHIVCFSGGHSSALVAIEVVRRYGNEDVILLNHDINPSYEDADIKRFKSQVAEYLGFPIDYANYRGIENPNDLPDQFDICIDKKAIKPPNTGNAFCTHYLKTKPFYEYLNEHFPTQNCIIYYGFDSSEEARVVRREGILIKDGWETDFPLARWTERTIHSTMEIGITPPATYSQFKHANCIGCLKGGIQHWYVVYCTRPDVWEKAKLMEQTVGYTILKRTIKKQTAPLALIELEEIFKNMKCNGVPASEHLEPARFKRALKAFKITEWSLFKPCECTF